MSRIFRYGNNYCSIETARYLAFVCIDGSGHVTDARNTRTILDCLKLLKKETGKTWRWIA